MHGRWSIAKLVDIGRRQDSVDAQKQLGQDGVSFEEFFAGIPSAPSFPS